MSLALIVFVLFMKNLIFHHFWGRLTTLEHFLRHFGHGYGYKGYSILFRIENGVNNVRTSQIVWRPQSPVKFLPNPPKLLPFRVPLPRKTFFGYRKRKKRQKASHFLSLSPKNVFLPMYTPQGGVEKTIFFKKGFCQCFNAVLENLYPSLPSLLLWKGKKGWHMCWKIFEKWQKMTPY